MKILFKAVALVLLLPLSFQQNLVHFCHNVQKTVGDVVYPENVCLKFKEDIITLFPAESSSPAVLAKVPSKDIKDQNSVEIVDLLATNKDATQIGYLVAHVDETENLSPKVRLHLRAIGSPDQPPPTHFHLKYTHHHRHFTISLDGSSNHCIAIQHDNPLSEEELQNLKLMIRPCAFHDPKQLFQDLIASEHLTFLGNRRKELNYLVAGKHIILKTYQSCIHELNVKLTTYRTEEGILQDQQMQQIQQHVQQFQQSSIMKDLPQLPQLSQLPRIQMQYGGPNPSLQSQQASYFSVQAHQYTKASQLEMYCQTGIQLKQQEQRQLNGQIKSITELETEVKNQMQELQGLQRHITEEANRQFRQIKLLSASPLIIKA